MGGSNIRNVFRFWQQARFNLTIKEHPNLLSTDAALSLHTTQHARLLSHSA